MTRPEALASSGIAAPSDQDIVASADAAIAEIRGHIDHRAKDAEMVDTKAATLLTLTVGALTLVAVRVQELQADEQRLPAIATALVVGTLVLCLFQAMRPRERFSYGADPKSLVAIVTSTRRR